MIREIKEEYFNEQVFGFGGGGGDAGVSFDPDALTVKLIGKGGKPANPVTATGAQVTNYGPAVRQAVGAAYDKFATSVSDPKNLAKIGAATLAGGALLGGGLALGRRIANIGAKKDKKKLKEAGKDRDKDDLYYKQVNLDPYAPQYTASQLASTAGGITGGALGYTAGLAGGQKIGTALGKALGMASPVPGFGIVGAGIGGALGGALGTVGAYQLAKMARPKKKKPKKLVQYYR
jgi:hypothetical protein